MVPPSSSLHVVVFSSSWPPKTPEPHYSGLKVCPRPTSYSCLLLSLGFSPFSNQGMKVIGPSSYPCGVSTYHVETDTLVCLPGNPPTVRVLRSLRTGPVTGGGRGPRVRSRMSRHNRVTVGRVHTWVCVGPYKSGTGKSTVRVPVHLWATTGVEIGLVPGNVRVDLSVCVCAYIRGCR